MFSPQFFESDIESYLSADERYLPYTWCKMTQKMERNCVSSKTGKIPHRYCVWWRVVRPSEVFAFFDHNVFAAWNPTSWNFSRRPCVKRTW